MTERRTSVVLADDNDVLREEMRNTPIYSRESQGFLEKARERQRLLARLEALRTLERTS